MPTRQQILVAVISAIVAHDLATIPLRRQLKYLAAGFIHLDEHNTSLTKQMEYMIHLLNENDIELDEFDLIALPNVISRS